MTNMIYTDLLFAVGPRYKSGGYLYISSDIDKLLLIPFSKSDRPFSTVPLRYVCQQ